MSTSQVALYIPFGPTSGSQNGRFKQDLQKAASLYDPIQDLLDVLNASKKSMKCVLYQPVADSEGSSRCSEDIYIGHFVSHLDWDLEKWGEQFGFLRGFPFIWRPGRYIDFKGFRIKFRNDELQDDIPLDADAVCVDKKLSGYLTHLITWISDSGEACYTVCSKNSADSTIKESSSTMSFPADGQKVWEPFVSYDLICHLESRHWHLNAETLSLRDQCHGTNVLAQKPVVTSISQGMKVIVASGEEMVIDVPPINSDGKHHGFVTHQGFLDRINFCVEQNLPVLDSVILTGAAAKMILTMMHQHRDFLDDNSTEKILADVVQAHPDLVKMVKGTETHAGVLGSRLEGFVLHIIDSGSVTEKCPSKAHLEKVRLIESGCGKVLKFKLPGYTGVTMCLREALKKKMNRKLADYSTMLNSWCDRWCLTPDGKAYWTDFFWDAMFKACDGVHSESELVARHILLTNTVEDEWKSYSAAEMIEVRTAINVRRSQALLDAPTKLIGQYTVVAPFYKSFDTIERTLRQADIEVVLPKKKAPKSAKGWVRLVNMPTKMSTNTGPVFQLPPLEGETLEQWQLDKIVDDPDIIKVESLKYLVASIIQRAKQDHIDALNVDSDDMMEQQLQDTIQTLGEELKLQVLNPREHGEGPMMLMLIGLQCVGKSYLTKMLEEIGVKCCSADKHMELICGKGNYDPNQLNKAHQCCMLDALTYLEQGFDVVIDNTNICAPERSIYQEIAKVTNARLVKVPLLHNMWLTGDDQREELVKTLVKRAQVRERTTGKSIGDAEKTIRRTMDKAQKDFAKYGSNDLETWLNAHPNPDYPLGFSYPWGKRALMYRNLDISEIVTDTLSSDTRLTQRPNFENELLKTWIKRGVREWHITVVGPNEIDKLEKPVQKNLKSPTYWLEYDVGIPFSEPVCKGVGRANDDDGNMVFYLVIEWEWGQKLRSKLGLPSKDFHVTLFWSGENDIHGVDKGISTLI